MFIHINGHAINPPRWCGARFLRTSKIYKQNMDISNSFSIKCVRLEFIIFVDMYERCFSLFFAVANIYNTGWCPFSLSNGFDREKEKSS